MTNPSAGGPRKFRPPYLLPGPASTAAHFEACTPCGSGRSRIPAQASARRALLGLLRTGIRTSHSRRGLTPEPNPTTRATARSLLAATRRRPPAGSGVHDEQHQRSRPRDVRGVSSRGRPTRPVAVWAVALSRRASRRRRITRRRNEPSRSLPGRIRERVEVQEGRRIGTIARSRGRRATLRP